jgi:hypothetical protein
MAMQLAKPAAINKILIVGQPSSDYRKVEALLNSCGMNTARPSRRDGFSPAEISLSLSKAHGVPAVETLPPGAKIKQIKAGTIWHGMALDLMLGNLDQELWGWADSQSVFWLNYWKQLDPRITFILIYDAPQSVLTNAALGESNLTEEELKCRLDAWCEFNAALLQFFHRNPTRCMLVNAQQACLSATSYLEQVSARIDAPLLDRLTKPASAGEVPFTSDAANNGAFLLDDAASQVTDETGEVPQAQELVEITTAPSHRDLLKHYLAEALIGQHEASRQLYEELQSIANLPLAEGAVTEINPINAWAALSQLQRDGDELVEQNQAQYAQIESLNQSLAEAVAVAENRLLHLEQLEHTKADIECAAQNEIEQLRLAQANAERQSAESKKQIEQLNQQLNAQTKLTQEQASKLKKAATKPSDNSEELKKHNELMLLQLHQAQEELERFYIQNQRAAIKGQTKEVEVPKTAAKAPEPPSLPLGAVSRVKSQLNYRLGATMIERSRSFSGRLSLPWALMREIRQYRREGLQMNDIELPPLASYGDVLEAQKVEQHLSYRLGAVLISNARSPVGWVRLPWAIRQEVKDFRRRHRR